MKTTSPTLLATCGRCGDAVIQVRRARVVRTAGAGGGWYGFDCPTCASSVRTAAPEHVLDLLTCLGAHENKPEAPALTMDDLLDLRAALALTQDVAAAAGLSGPGRSSGRGPAGGRPGRNAA